MSSLALRWRRALPVGVDPAAADRAAADLIGRWAQSHRHHHGLGHLVAVLAVVDAHAGEAADPDAVRLAAWFHDAVYEPTRDDNEPASAALAAAALPPLGVSGERVAEVHRLVLLTAGHDPVPGDPDGALLCDADLAILAAPAATYATYARNIRREYAHVPEDAFRLGRAAVLTRLLALPALFHVPILRDRWESAARSNLENELRRLAA